MCVALAPDLDAFSSRTFHVACTSQPIQPPRLPSPLPPGRAKRCPVLLLLNRHCPLPSDLQPALSAAAVASRSASPNGPTARLSADPTVNRHQPLASDPGIQVADAKADAASAMHCSPTSPGRSSLGVGPQCRQGLVQSMDVSPGQGALRALQDQENSLGRAGLAAAGRVGVAVGVGSGAGPRGSQGLLGGGGGEDGMEVDVPELQQEGQWFTQPMSDSQLLLLRLPLQPRQVQPQHPQQQRCQLAADKPGSRPESQEKAGSQSQPSQRQRTIAPAAAVMSSAGAAGVAATGSTAAATPGRAVQPASHRSGLVAPAAVTAAAGMVCRDVEMASVEAAGGAAAGLAGGVSAGAAAATAAAAAAAASAEAHPVGTPGKVAGEGGDPDMGLLSCCSPPGHVAAFLYAVLRRMVPPKLLGSVHNWRWGAEYEGGVDLVEG